MEFYKLKKQAHYLINEYLTAQRAVKKNGSLQDVLKILRNKSNHLGKTAIKRIVEESGYKINDKDEDTILI